MKKLNKIFRILVYILPAVLFFSYYPVISLGVSETMNYELSLPLLWLLVFDLVAAVIFAKRRDFSFFKKWRWWLFPIFVTISLIWSVNLVRGILTVGIMWLVVFAIYAILHLRQIFQTDRGFSYVFLRFFFGTTLFVSAWCATQCILDIFGISREYTLLCRGCIYVAFGFPHPNGFAIEPQFMGNLLLAPAIVAAAMILSDKKSELGRLYGDVFHNKSALLFGVAFAVMATLFLTFSRGAIYAFIVAMMFMSGAFLVRKVKFKKIATMWGIIVFSFLFSLNIQGIFSQVSPTNDTYFSGISKVLNHLSLGIVDVRGEVDEGVTSGGAFENESEFDGYVEESTNVRMELSRNAIEVWRRDFGTMMFGVGIGGAGQAMYDAGLTGSPKEIVQNEYISLLLEVGLVGIFLAILTFVMALRIVKESTISVTILTLMIAYGVSLLFFSGLANALQIYLLPVVLYIVLRKKLVS